MHAYCIFSIFVQHQSFEGGDHLNEWSGLQGVLLVVVAKRLTEIAYEWIDYHTIEHNLIRSSGGGSESHHRDCFFFCLIRQVINMVLYWEFTVKHLKYLCLHPWTLATWHIPCQVAYSRIRCSTGNRIYLTLWIHISQIFSRMYDHQLERFQEAWNASRKFKQSDGWQRGANMQVSEIAKRELRTFI